MVTKTFKLFGFKIFEITTYEKGEQPIPEGKPKGLVLEYTPEQARKDRDKEITKKITK